MNDEKMNDPEEQVEINKCLCCKTDITGKPWISVRFEEDDYTVHACKYICANNLSNIIGPGYWNKVVNKEDFTEPRPVSNYKCYEDITANFGIEEIRDEIELEEERIFLLEEEYDYSSEDNFEEEIYYM